MNKIFYLILALIISAGISISDWNYANYYKLMAEEMKSKYPDKVWTIGHWGWQWYARQNDMQIFDSATSDIKNGDYLIFPGDIAKQAFPDSLDIQLVEKHYKQTSLLNIFSGSNHASLYNSFYYRPAWTFSRQPFDTIYVYRIDCN
jgi:hypothetical protein